MNVSYLIVSSLVRIIMYAAIQFHNQLEFVTVEVDDVTADRELPSKLQPKHASISQQHPGPFFCTSIDVPHFTRMF